MPNPEFGPPPEETGITPDKELQYAMQGLEAKDWGEVTDCLNQFVIKSSEVQLSDEEKNSLKAEFENIKNACSAAEDMPDSYRSQVERLIQQAEEVLK